MENQTLQQYSYHKWANSRIFDRLDELPDEVYGRKIKSVFSSVEEVIIHIYRVDGMWLSAMSGDTFDETMVVINQLKEKAADQGLNGMRNLYSEMALKYDAFLDQRDLDEGMSIEHPRYGKLDTPVSEMVKHVG